MCSLSKGCSIAAFWPWLAYLPPANSKFVILKKEPKYVTTVTPIQFWL